MWFMFCQNFKNNIEKIKWENERKKP
jgi:hypothetical protein